MRAKHECAICSVPVKAIELFCDKCFELYRNEPWAIAMKKNEQQRRDAIRKRPLVLNFSSLSINEIEFGDKVAWLSLCRCCNHSQRDLIDKFCRDRSVRLDDGTNLATAKQLIAYLKDNFPGDVIFDPPCLSLHKKNHMRTSQVAALVFTNGTITTADGQELGKVSVIDYLDAVITLAHYNMLQHPDRVTATQGNEAVGLKYKLQKGVVDDAEIKKAYADHFRERARRAKRANKETDIIDAEFTVTETETEPE
jgi:hypothetical protein